MTTKDFMLVCEKERLMHRKLFDACNNIKVFFFLKFEAFYRLKLFSLSKLFSKSAVEKFVSQKERGSRKKKIIIQIRQRNFAPNS